MVQPRLGEIHAVEIPGRGRLHEQEIFPGRRGGRGRGFSVREACLGLLQLPNSDYATPTSLQTTSHMYNTRASRSSEPSDSFPSTPTSPSQESLSLFYPTRTIMITPAIERTPYFLRREGGRTAMIHDPISSDEQFDPSSTEGLESDSRLSDSEARARITGDSIL